LITSTNSANCTRASVQILSEICHWIAQAATEFGLAAFNVKVSSYTVERQMPPMHHQALM
jgi:hypothetical protein